MRPTISVVLLCNLHYSLTFPNFFSDQTVGGDGASSSLLMNFVAEQPNIAGLLPQTFNNNEQSGAKQACGWGPDGAKKNSVKEEASFCSQDDAPKTPTQESGQQPVGNPKSKPTGPEDSPASDDAQPGERYKEYEAWPSTNWMRKQPWLEHEYGAEDGESKMCEKRHFIICDAGNPLFRIAQIGTPFYVLLLYASECKFFFSSFFFFFLQPTTIGD